ncbi:MAG: 23S rRNA (pseudouridine(1915)-N(3))-methyltransferase RlmH [Clostridia bacterium]|nr:23S rRNA (pseudouridine(1915)-N(3))-methyltransferase RlmH [Clostridia bacterium]
MTQLTLLAVGGLKEPFWQEALAEYVKRLSAYARVEVTELREERIRDESDPTGIERALEEEGKRILARVPADAVLFALCVEGKEVDSPGLARLLAQAQDKCGKLVFAVGSSHGLSPAVKERADVRLSLSRLTFPHQMARVILAEAVYRGFCIRAGKPYHK